MTKMFTHFMFRGTPFLDLSYIFFKRINAKKVKFVTFLTFLILLLMKILQNRFTFFVVLSLLILTRCALIKPKVQQTPPKRMTKDFLQKSLDKDAKYMRKHWSQEEIDYFYKNFVFNSNSFLPDTIPHH